MRTLSIPTGKLLVIPGETLPEDAAGITVKNGEVFWLSDMRGYGEESLPPGSWSIVGWSDELTEDQCADFVDSWESVSGDGTIIYQRYPDEIPKCRTAIKSFQSLLRSHGITDRALIIKKEKL